MSGGNDEKMASGSTGASLPKHEKAYRQKIRRRESYKLMQRIFDVITDHELDDTTRLEKHFEILDSQHGFGSQTAAGYARESLNLFIEDKENGIDDDEPEQETA